MKYSLYTEGWNGSAILLGQFDTTEAAEAAQDDWVNPLDEMFIVEEEEIKEASTPKLAWVPKTKMGRQPPPRRQTTCGGSSSFGLGSRHTPLRQQ